MSISNISVIFVNGRLQEEENLGRHLQKNVPLKLAHIEPVKTDETVSGTVAAYKTVFMTATLIGTAAGNAIMTKANEVWTSTATAEGRQDLPLVCLKMESARALPSPMVDEAELYRFVEWLFSGYLGLDQEKVSTFCRPQGKS